MRYNDSRDGTNEAERVLEKYNAALEKKGMLQPDGLWSAAYLVKQKVVAPAKQANHTAWNNAFMNTWNSDFVRSNWRRQSLGHLTKTNDKTKLQWTKVAQAYRSIVADNGGQEPKDVEATLAQARELSKSANFPPALPFEAASRGLFMMMLSEMGGQEELNDLLEFADQALNPTWERGGLFYPRNDLMADERGDFVHVEPHSGNSAIGYARLNVEDGQKKMWDRPWTRETLASRPWVDGMTLGDDVDFLRGAWDEAKRALVFTARLWDMGRSTPKEASFTVKNLRAGDWAVYVNGELQKAEYVGADGELRVNVSVAPLTEVDVVVWQGVE